MRVILPDSSELNLPEGATGLDAAAAIGPKLAKEAVLVRANGRVQDVRLPLEDGQPIQILTTRDTEDPDALYVLRHSAAHLLAEAVRRLYPGTKIAIGPPIENGFYYDFEFPEPIGEDALEKIEAEIRRELKEGRAWERQEVAPDEAKRLFAEQGEDYKVELVDTAEGDISLYTQGDFTDLCRGPHLQDSKPIKAIKLTGLAGAYWRGDENNTQLTRIYGTAFYSQEDLDAYLERLEEAKKRDHRRLGVQLDLVHFDEHSPGSPLWHPKGMVIWNELEKIRKRENDKRGYLEVKTPIIYNEETFITSGHFPKYEDLMFKLEVDEHRYAMKAMNCPGHMLLFGSKLRSYRELPLRYAEPAPLHRNEITGTLHGLLRVRHITQDDAHIFCTEEQIQDEIAGVVDYARYLYGLFGMTASAELATRPDNKLGDDAQWDMTEAALEEALKLNEIPYEIAEGEGAFYGPKIDLFMDDALGRKWQMGTIQLDSQMPSRFGLTYVGPRQHRARALRRPPRSLRVVRALHRHSHRALRRRFSALARARPGAGRSGRRGSPRGGESAGREAFRLPGGGRRLRRDGRQANPQRRGREDPLRGRLGGQGVGGLARRARAGWRAIDQVARRARCGASRRC